MALPAPAWAVGTSERPMRKKLLTMNAWPKPITRVAGARLRMPGCGQTRCRVSIRPSRPHIWMTQPSSSRRTGPIRAATRAVSSAETK
ncbi:Uncharacterised protein [Pseudomonas aeruginosa]|nr:Uncharacterised protein [Pseudomonas aeruginosa]